jgi:anti-sigma factor RsiW
MRWRRRDLLCREAVELVTDYLEGTLSRSARARLETHLAGCPNCTAYVEQMRATIAAMGRLEPDALTPEARDELVALYQRWIADR